MEALPVIEVVEIDRIENLAVVGITGCGKNSGPSGLVMVVSIDRRVVSSDFGIIKATVGGAPRFASDVGWLIGFDENEKTLTVDPEGIEGHLVEAGTRRRVVGVKLADGVERGYLPISLKDV